MIQKWKRILTNWINCYCNESDNNEIDISLESILDIISRLRKNFNLDESRSSTLDALTIQEFIIEKYPDFTFENGSSQPITEDDLFMSASLLLYFLCVNSKNIDLKNAMCSKLNSSDQEVILKFSKRLMSCSHITSSEVLTAIAEACGQDIAGVDIVSPAPVTETPPAIRSLHSEVRRLQAALDAERFDRTYLQEELSRTNLKLENLSKLKEQYKLEIVNLKAQVFECCGEESETNNDATNNNSIKLAKQLELTEERLVNVQEELGNTQYERNMYKNKLDDLKRERDKYLALSEQECIRAGELAESLEVERQQCNSLKELVAELQQHNRLNRLDTSQLECDDLDSSLRSLQHNASVCSEACANVIEVQLSEERAKIDTLKHQIQMLQKQLSDQNEKYNNEIRTYNDILSEKDANIMDLKHRINEEIEKINVLKAQYDDDKTKTNNEINELEQSLKLTTENTRKAIETKIQEIHQLQEEKLSLLQSFSNKITKLENVIQDQKSQMELEKSSKHKMREDFDNHIMKLNEKVLNRNNELVELQNKIVKQGEELEQLQLQLRNENDLRQELINTHNKDVIYYNEKMGESSQTLQQKCEEISDLQTQLQSLTSEKENYIREKEVMQHKLDEKNEIVNSLRTQLQTEIDFKNDVQNTMRELETANNLMTKEIERLNEDLSKAITENANICRILSSTDSSLKEEKEYNHKLKQEYDDLKSKMELLLETVDQKEKKISLLEEEIKSQQHYREKLINDHESEALVLRNMVVVTESVMEDQKLSLSNEIAELVTCKDNLEEQLKQLEILNKTQRQEAELALNTKVTELENVIQASNAIKEEKDHLCDNIIKLQRELEKEKLEKTILAEKILHDKKHLTESLEQNKEAMILLEEHVETLKNQQQNFIDDHTSIKFDLENKIDVLESALKQEKNNSEIKIIEEQRINDVLQKQLDDLQHLIESEKKNTENELCDKIRDLENVLKELNTIKKEKVAMSDKLAGLENEILEKTLHIDNLRDEKNKLISSLEKKTQELMLIENEIKSRENEQEKQVKDFELEKVKLETMLVATNTLIMDQKKILSKEVLQHERTKAEFNEQMQIAEANLNAKVSDFNIAVEELNASKNENMSLLENISKLQKDLSERVLQVEGLELKNTVYAESLDENKNVIMLLEDKTKSLKQRQEKLISEFDAERLEFQNKVLTLEEVLENTKRNNDKTMSEYFKSNEVLQIQIKHLEEMRYKEKESADIKLSKNLSDFNEITKVLETLKEEKKNLHEDVKKLQNDVVEKEKLLDGLTNENKDFIAKINKIKKGTEDTIVILETTISSGLTSILSNLKKEHIDLDVIQKLEQANESNIDLNSNLNLIIETAIVLTKQLSLNKTLEEALVQGNTAVEKMTVMVKQKDDHIIELQEEIRNLHKIYETSKIGHLKELEEYKTLLEEKIKHIENLNLQNETLHSQHNNVKIQMDTKIHSLQDQLINNENLTEKLKTTYESQISNLNIMVSKLTNYLKEKTIETESLRNEKDQLQFAVENCKKEIELLQKELKVQNINHQKLINEFESERVVLKNMVAVTESLMDDNKMCLNNKLEECVKINEQLKERVKQLEDNVEVQRIDHNNKVLEYRNSQEQLKEQVKQLEDVLKTERQDTEIKVKEKVAAFDIVLKELSHIKDENEILSRNIKNMEEDLLTKTSLIDVMINEKKNMQNMLEQKKLEISSIEKHMNEENEKENFLHNEIASLKDHLNTQNESKKKIQSSLEMVTEEKKALVKQLEESNLLLAAEQSQRLLQLDELHSLRQVQAENEMLNNAVKEKELEIMNMQEEVKNKMDQSDVLRDSSKVEQMNLLNKCNILQEYQLKAEDELKQRQSEIDDLQEEVKSLHKQYVNIVQRNSEKDEVVETLSKELEEARKSYLQLKQDIEKRDSEIQEITEKLNKANSEVLENLRKENELLIKAAKETYATNNDDFNPKCITNLANVRELQNQVYDSAIDNTPTSLESCKTITDLEKIVQEKNRSITTLLSDVTYLKTIIAESENKLLDVSKDLVLSKENCHQLSCQLKKIVHQKNEEISELKKQVSKMSVTENRASQIIRVSAKYQAIILKRIAEIKSNSVLKELTNFGNTTGNCDNELRRSLNAGAVTMEDLENFLETTDRHLRRCSEKQITLQKEKDRLTEIKQINESEIITMRKFLTELSVSIKTFNSVKDLYTQKLSRIVSIQRTVRRDILSLDGRVTDATMCKLERGYAAAMQDLSECALNLQRWVDRSIGRSISPEKIKQAFMSDVDRESLLPTTFQNTSLEVQLDELEGFFQKLLEEVIRAQKGEGAKDTQALTVMEVRAEYEDKLNRMKAKMKQLYTEQVAIFKEKQREELEVLNKKLQKANEKLLDTSKAYEDHIRGLTAELWNVGEKFIIKQDEAQWLRKKQMSGSLMSLQHVHSSGLAAPQEHQRLHSDSHSLRSLPVHNPKTETKEGRGLHMSDEEGEVFDNRFLRELSTPRRPVPGARLSELRWRNSMCPPHLKSSYPAETQFAPALHEEEIKCSGTMSLGGKQRKEVGITAYKKPGPPTPSKQAGRLSATDSELRESLRVEAEPSARRTGTPSRLFSLFRSSRHDTQESTPRTRRLSNIFRKK